MGHLVKYVAVEGAKLSVQRPSWEKELPEAWLPNGEATKIRNFLGNGLAAYWILERKKQDIMLAENPEDNSTEQQILFTMACCALVKYKNERRDHLLLNSSITDLVQRGITLEILQQNVAEGMLVPSDAQIQAQAA